MTQHSTVTIGFVSWGMWIEQKDSIIVMLHTFDEAQTWISRIQFLVNAKWGKWLF